MPSLKKKPVAPWAHELAKRMRDARLAAGLTQNAAALAAGLSRVTIWNYEHANYLPLPENLINLARLYKVEFESFEVEVDPWGELVPAGSVSQLETEEAQRLQRKLYEVVEQRRLDEAEGRLEVLLDERSRIANASVYPQVSPGLWRLPSEGEVLPTVEWDIVTSGHGAAVYTLHVSSDDSSLLPYFEPDSYILVRKDWLRMGQFVAVEASSRITLARAHDMKIFPLMELSTLLEAQGHSLDEWQGVGLVMSVKKKDSPLNIDKAIQELKLDIARIKARMTDPFISFDVS